MSTRIYNILQNMQTFLVIDLNERTLFLHSTRDRKHMRM